MVLNLFLPILQLLYSLQTSHSLITNVNIMFNIHLWTYQYHMQVISCGCCLMHHHHDVGFFLHWDSCVTWIFDPLENPPCCFQRTMLPPAFSIDVLHERCRFSKWKRGCLFLFCLRQVFWILHLHTSEWPVYILHLQLYVKYTCFVQYISVTNLQWGCKSYFMLYFVQWHNSRRRQFFQTKQIFPNGLFKWIVQQSKPCTLFVKFN